MNSILNELVNPNTSLLTDTQKAVLCLIVVANSPEMALNSALASKNLSNATRELDRLGLVDLYQNGLSITSSGTEALQQHNLVDNTNMLTQDGKDALESATTVGKTYNSQETQEIQETFDFLKSLG